jgi:hypothetical protein
MKTFQEFLKEASCSRTSVEEFEKLISKFLPFVVKELKMKKSDFPPMHFPHSSRANELHSRDIPGITFTTDSDSGQMKYTWGQTNNKNHIVVHIANRHPLDVLRTLAHEMVHYHQQLIGVHCDGSTGSSTENEANSRAAVMMRNFGSEYPKVFKMHPIG